MSLFDTLKRIASLVLVVFLSFSNLPFSMFVSTAATETSEAAIYAAKSTGGIFSIGRKAIEKFNDGAASDKAEIIKTTLDETNAVELFPHDDASWPVSITKNYEDTIDISSYNELYFKIDMSKKPSCEIVLSVSLRTSYGYFTLTGNIPPNNCNDVYVPLSGIKGCEKVSEISLSFSSVGDPVPLKISYIYGDSNYSYEHIERFCAERFFSQTGIEVYENKILPNVKEGNAEFRATVISNFADDANTVTALVSISGVKNGTMTFSVKNAIKNEINDIATVTLFEGTNYYPFTFDKSKGTSSYFLKFSGITLSDGEVLTVNSVGLSAFSERFNEYNDPPATISSCTLSSNSSKIQISGTLSSSTAAANMDKSLGIVAEDIWKNDITNIIAKGDMSTVFSFTVSSDALRFNSSFYRFYLVLINGDEFTKLSNGVYTAIPSPNIKSGKTPFGIQSNDPSDVFYSNASHTVIDVYLDKLENSDSAGGRIHSYAGKYKYINNSYVNELDSKINFSLKSGIPTYIRIMETTSPETGRSVSYSYSFNVYNYELSIRYMILVDFLASRYDGISGYIVGTRADSKDYNYCDKKNLISYAENYALILRMTSIAIRNNNSNAFVSVSVGDEYSYSRQTTTSRNLSYNEFTGLGEYTFETSLFCEVLSKAILKYGGFNWYITYECENSPDSKIDIAYKLYNLMLQGGGTTPSGHILYWQPETAIDTEIFSKIFSTALEKTASYGTRAVILSLTKQSNNIEKIVDIINSVNFEGQSERQIFKELCFVTDSSESNTGYYLWDFRKSFSTEGFVATGTITSLTTDYSTTLSSAEILTDCRALRGVTDTSKADRGIILCYFDNPISPLKLDSINIMLYIENEGTNDTETTVTLGSGNKRYDYEIALSDRKAVEISCNTSVIKETETIDYIAITFKSQYNIRFDISGITAKSGQKTAEEISQSLDMSISKKNNENKKDINIAVASGIFITFAVFAAMSIKQESPKKKTKSNI